MLGSLKESALSLRRDGLRVRRMVAACKRLLSERGEASGASIAAATLAQYQALGPEEQLAFFRALRREFSPDPKQVLKAARDYEQSQDGSTLAALIRASEPPRQELLRRLNRAPGGTRGIVAMRERLLEAIQKDRTLRPVDEDFHHLLSSWFNPGFLKVARVDWNTPAALLEQLIHHEAVHEIRGWGDLRRRLEHDRRCFAFFHPALPDEPLIFVEVALVADMPGAIAPLIDAQAKPGPGEDFKVAVFYSISNCQPGLRGVSLGNFLIKQVVALLAAEFPKLRRYCTLSPVPGFRDWVKATLARDLAEQIAAFPEATRASLGRIGEGFLPWLERPVDLREAEKARQRYAPDLERLCAAYLLGLGEPDKTTRDPVARFHLHNGARLDRINCAGDDSDKGLRQSLGLMVNYVYEPRAIEANHERFIAGTAAASRPVRALAG
jgi:malonyl-CoA decarboxylase